MVGPSIRRSVRQSVHQSVRQSVSWSVHRSVSPSRFRRIASGASRVGRAALVIIISYGLCELLLIVLQHRRQTTTTTTSTYLVSDVECNATYTRARFQLAMKNVAKRIDHSPLYVLVGPSVDLENTARSYYL